MPEEIGVLLRAYGYLWETIIRDVHCRVEIIVDTITGFKNA